jgi:hypothetical protein
MQGGDAKKVASQVLDSAYNYQDGNMTLFKPTLTSGAQTFRLTKQGALAYFVGGKPRIIVHKSALPFTPPGKTS